MRLSPRSARFAVGTTAGLVLALVAGLGSPGSADAAVAATSHPATPSAIRIAAASHPLTDHAHRRWLPATRYVHGGHLTTTRHAIAGTTSPHLYQVERTGTQRYRIPMRSGQYRVRLQMAEQRFSTAGKRVFGVVAEGHLAVARIDVAAKVGRFHAYQVTFPVRVTGGYLDLRLVKRVGTPAISGVEAVRVTTPAHVSRTSPGTDSSAGTTTAVVRPETYGAVGNGVTDDTVALQEAFDNAPAGVPVLLTPGRVYAHSNLLYLRKPGLQVTGGGVLLATNEARSSVWIQADDVHVDGVTFKTAHTTQRWGAWEQMGLRIDGHTGAVLSNITVQGSAAAGIYVGGGASNFLLDHVTVQNTRADGIHMTDGSHNGKVVSPIVRNSGDDGVAVVSYSQDGTPCHDIQITSPSVFGTTWGRGLSVVGGTNITETNIDVENSDAAAVYIAAEGSPWFTAAPQNVSITGGKIVSANTDPTVDHGAVLVMAGENTVTPHNIWVSGLTITSTRATASRDFGVVTYGMNPTGVVFSHLTIKGGPRSACSGNAPQSSYQTRSIVQNGVQLPNRG